MNKMIYIYIFYLLLLIDINGVKISGNIWIIEWDKFENYIETKSIEFIYTFLSSLLLLCFCKKFSVSLQRVYHRATISFLLFFFFFLFFLDEISIKTRLHYLIWWRGKLFQDKLPIRFRLARCCSPLGRHFWSTPSRYRCFYTRLCKISERKFSRVRRIWPIIKIPRFLSIDFYRSKIELENSAELDISG